MFNNSNIYQFYKFFFVQCKIFGWCPHEKKREKKIETTIKSFTIALANRRAMVIASPFRNVTINFKQTNTNSSSMVCKCHGVVKVSSYYGVDRGVRQVGPYLIWFYQFHVEYQTIENTMYSW